MPTDSDKPRFEPPPWEKEAFDRFQKEQKEAKQREDLRATLEAVRNRAASPAAGAASPETGVRTATGAPADDPEEAIAAGSASSRQTATIPEARIQAMLVELRGEEPPIVPKSSGLVNGVIAFMTVGGVIIIIESAKWFAQSRSSQVAGTLLAGTLSMVMFLVGIAFIGGAVLLFRKYRQ